MVASIVSFLSGLNPLADPIVLLLLQIIIITSFSRIVGLVTRYFHQPQVVAEVIGGILLGKSALSSIPRFQQNVFPDSSIPLLYLIANLGLTFYLFLIGLELDVKSVVRDVKKSIGISLAGIAIPFAFGAGVSVFLYNKLMPAGTTVAFSSFLIFTGVAMSITAFPVLARMLNEMNLLETNVGRTAISAAACDDVIAWCMLLIVVAIINNSGNYLVALYAFLAVAAWALFLVFAIRPIFIKFVKKMSDQDGIPQSYYFVTMLLVLVSGWFTEAAGVHAIFGAFLAGLVTPREKDFSIKIAEKMEDFIVIVLLPLFFTYSGLNTRLDNLNVGVAWEAIILVVLVACLGKIVGCTVASKLHGMSTRESFSVGFLMNTKGLVELIVLNLGLNAGVISPLVFTVMVVMALVTTCMTIPVIRVIYPRKFYQAIQTGKISTTEPICSRALPAPRLSKDGFETMKLLYPAISVESSKSMVPLVHKFGDHNSVELYAIRLVNSDDRPTAIMRTYQSGSIDNDRALSMIRTVADLNHMPMYSMLHLTPLENFADHIIEASMEVDMIIMNNDEHHNDILSKVRTLVSCSVGLFNDKGIGHEPNDELLINQNTVRSMNSFKIKSMANVDGVVYVPFVGGVHDREALTFALRFSKKSKVVVLAFCGTETDSIEKNRDSDLLDYCRKSNNQNIKLEEKTLQGDAISELINILKSYAVQKSDLVVFGKLNSEMFKSYMNGECLSSSIEISASHLGNSATSINKMV